MINLIETFPNYVIYIIIINGDSPMITICVIIDCGVTIDKIVLQYNNEKKNQWNYGGNK